MKVLPLHLADGARVRGEDFIKLGDDRPQRMLCFEQFDKAAQPRIEHSKELGIVVVTHGSEKCGIDNLSYGSHGVQRDEFEQKMSRM